MATRKIEVAITGDASSLERAFRRSGRAADSFGTKVNGAAVKGMKTLGLLAGGVVVAGVAAAGLGLVKSAKAAAEAEASNARLRAQLKALGKDSVGVRTNIDKTVQSLSGLSGFDDEDLQDSFTNLVRTTGNVQKAQGQLGLIADIARGKQISLASATNMLNRVNAGNVGSLKKLGIQVDKNTTKEQALAMLRQKFAGQAEAYGKTAAGAQERLAVGMENAFEQVGVALTPLIAAFADFATNQLPGIAKAVSIQLGAAIAWLKANWPQIRAVLGSVWAWYQTYIQSVLVPTLKTIASGIGSLVGFIKLHMPEIRAVFASVFGWINTNIVPTVRTVATGVAAAVGFMTRVWHEHGNDIKAMLGPLFNTIKTVIVNALNIIKGVVEVALALIRGDWSKAWSSFKTVAATAIDSFITILLTIPRMLLAVGKIVGRELIEGVKQGFSAAAGALKSFLEQKIRDIVSNLNPFSPVAHGGEIHIGRELMRGAAQGVDRNKPRLAKSLSKAVKDAVMSARGNLGSLTSGLSGMLGTLFGQSSPQAKRLAEIRAQQARENDVRRRAELQAAIDSAETDEDRAKAQQELSDYVLDYQASQLEQQISDRQQQYERDIANLTESFNTGKLSAQQFRDALDGIIGGQSGAELGAAFAGEFGRQLQAITQQIAALAGTPAGLGGPSVESPRAVAAAELKAWQDSRAARLAELEKAAKGKDTPGGKTITAAERKAIESAMGRWDSNHPKPKMLAMGGVLQRAVFAGEAGPEAVLPLSSGRAQSMLASALARADRVNTGGGTTVVNVHVAGNEFSARDFAKKLQPELNRLVGFGQV